METRCRSRDKDLTFSLEVGPLHMSNESYSSNSDGHIPTDVAFPMEEAAMIARQLFGRTGHESTRTIFGAAALSEVTQGRS